MREKEKELKGMDVSRRTVYGLTALALLLVALSLALLPPSPPEPRRPRGTTKTLATEFTVAPGTRTGHCPDSPPASTGARPHPGAAFEVKHHSWPNFARGRGNTTRGSLRRPRTRSTTRVVTTRRLGLPWGEGRRGVGSNAEPPCRSEVSLSGEGYFLRGPPADAP